jgi:transketolase
LGEEDLKRTKAAFGWPEDARFYVPAEVRERAAQAAKRGSAVQAGWEACFASYREAHPELAVAWELYEKGQLPAGWVDSIPEFAEAQSMATRVASGKVLDAIAPQLLTLVGGSADLTPSNNTLPKGATAVHRDHFEGMYIHFGVREHGMGALLNGLALHGLRPYGGTFLIFSDYMRPAIRLAAFMGLPVIYVFTHDSIGLGEDGPTHQPVEHLTALRAIPNLLVLRPADARETAAAWKVALQRSDGPSALVLTRQDLPVVTPVGDNLARGAYVLSRENADRPDLVLIATGSEVSLALAARDVLAEDGLAVRVISMPSWELFDAQTEAYRESVLPPGVPRLAIEAGRSLAWGRYLDGSRDSVLGLDRFGGSAPYKVLFEQLGFTAENVVARARKILAMQPQT